MSRASIASALNRATVVLDAAGVEQPRRDARLLLCHALDISPENLIRDPARGLSATERGRLDALTARRARREPISRITGRREFWSLPFRLSPDTLDPRPDSETLVEAILEALVADGRAGERNQTLLDLGTGSGCLLLALLRELPQARGLGVDRSAGACMVAADNAAALGLADRASFCVADWGRGLTGHFDVIVANPPYIPDAEIAGLWPEVAHYDPRSALAGGPDGLAAYRALTEDLCRLLAPGGIGGLELGANQGPAVRSILTAAGLEVRSSMSDLAGVERCILAQRARDGR